jgi:DNA polymerase-4
MSDKQFRYVLHGDLDAFYASVEQLDNPELRGKPVVVGGSSETRGVVAAASYEARKYGIKSAMAMSVAMRKCSNLVRVSPRFDRYRDVSYQVMEIFGMFSESIESISLDEAYLDVSTQKTMQMCNQVAANVRENVRNHTGLTITVGGGATKTVAKIASQLAKPDGMMLVAPGTERTFLAPLGVQMIPGIGPKSMDMLKPLGVLTIGQLAACDDIWLRLNFGVRGLELRKRAMGLDDTLVNSIRITKSVSAETTTPKDIGEEDTLMKELFQLSENVARRLGRSNLKGRTVSLKLRLADFTTFTRQTTLSVPVDDHLEIFRVVQKLLKNELKDGRPFRLLGVRVSNFSPVIQLSFPLP